MPQISSSSETPVGNSPAPNASTPNPAPAYPSPAPGFDSLLPAEVARKAEELGVKKANLDLISKGALAFMAGAYIAMGAVFATIMWTGMGNAAPWGWGRLVGGLAFSLGLIMVVIGGAELFTGNNLLVMAWASRKISLWQLMRNWVVVYAGNFIGSVVIVIIVFASKHFMANDGLLGLTALNVALKKMHLGFTEAVASGIMCNVLVCMAVWLTYSARTTEGKILAIVFPITAFVAAGFEHCVANMYFVPMAIFIKLGAPDSFWLALGKTPVDFADLGWANFIWDNLLPVTIGNIIGGAVFVGAIYWIIYLRKRSA